MADDTVKYFERDLVADAPQSAYTLTLASFNPDGSITVQPNGSVSLVINQAIFKTRLACQTLKQFIKFKGSPELSANYDPKGLAKMAIKYVGKPKADRSLIPFNRDLQLDVDVYANETVVRTDNVEIESITVTIGNQTTVDMVIMDIILYPSMDINPMQIVNVLNEQTIVGDVISATASFSKATFTQFLSTNVINRLSINSLGGGRVNIVDVQDWNMSFHSQKLSTTKQKQFSVTLFDVAGSASEIKFWHAVSPEHKLYGEAFTDQDPRGKFPSMSDVERDTWRLMVWEADDDDEKFAIKFVTVADVNGTTTETPCLIFGRGSDLDPTSLKGRMIQFKDYLGGHIIYTTTYDLKREIVMEEHLGGFRNMYNAREYVDEYDNGWEIKFKGDSPITVEAVYDEVGTYTGDKVNGVFSPYTRKSGRLSGT
jgi:hypothetical protein